MRVAEYVVPGASGRTDGGDEDAECTVVTFGAGQGGSLDGNVARWIKQFSPLAAPPSRTTRVVHGMTVTRIEVAGTYHPMLMPGAPGAGRVEPRARLVGAIVQTPSGEWFFKLTGPDATVKEAAPELDAMVDSVRQ